jgi:ABC-type Zn2+ transport system substrate-binding protein/surface adhesin
METDEDQPSRIDSESTDEDDTQADAMDADSNDEEEEDDESSEDDEDDDDDDEDEGHGRYQIDPWVELTYSVYAKYSDAATEKFEEYVQSGQSTRDAIHSTFTDLKPLYLKELLSRYRHLMELVASLKKDPTHRKIKESITEKRASGYDRLEAIESAVEDRRHLLKRKLSAGMQEIEFEEQ